MAETLPLRRASSVSAWFAAPLVQPEGKPVAEHDRPRVYIAPLGSHADELILRASLEAAGLRPPAWVASRRFRADEGTLRTEFLAGAAVLVPLASPRKGPDRLARLLHWARETGASVDLVPVETLWGPAQGAPSWRHLLVGNPYDPPSWRRWLRRPGAGRGVRVILGRPGTLAELARQAPTRDDALALSSFVRGQAVKALSQTERQVLGEQYKVPRMVVEQILLEPEFLDRSAAAGARAGLTRSESHRLAERALGELYATHNFLYMEFFRRFCRWLYRKAYAAEIRVDPAALERLRELSKRSALVFVPSHKSNFDHLILYYLLRTEGFPPPHTAAGKNMAFFPMSRILPRTGAYFIRRSFQDDPVYREALSSFIGYLVQHRFHQEFFIEGGRTRSGKQLPPRYGMLRYVVEGSRRNDVHDVHFIPTAISYDELLEVEEYARQVGGEEKEGESFGFLVRMIRSLRGRDFGHVHIGFGEPIALQEHLERAGDDRLVVEKLAFQIANAVNAQTTLTAVALLCSALCAAGRRALTLPELEQQVQRMLDYAHEHDIPVARELEQGAKATVESAIRAMRRSDVIELYDGGLEDVWSVSERRHLIASYYRNTVIHFFVNAAIAALARDAVQARPGGDVESWSLRLRDLLKFEFFFSERDAFRGEIAAETARLERDERRGMGPIGAATPGILLDYLESYWVATEALRALPPAPVPESELLQRCHAIGRQKLLQNDVHAPWLLSSLNFKNALRLAVNHGAAAADERGYRRGDDERLRELTGDLAFLAGLARRTHSDA